MGRQMFRGGEKSASSSGGSIASSFFNPIINFDLKAFNFTYAFRSHVYYGNSIDVLRFDPGNSTCSFYKVEVRSLTVKYYGKVIIM